MRDHEPKVIDKFNGLWMRGDIDSTPLDHFTDGQNFRFSGPSSIATRYGIGISQDVALPLNNVKRIYNYPTNTANTLIALTVATNGDGKIYHIVDISTVYLILTINGMTDFAFQPYAGRGYISPFKTFDVGGLNVEKGLQNEFLYVYAGDGTAARKAAGSPLAGVLTIANGAAGHTDAGLHIFAFVLETNSGYLAAPAQNTSFTTSPASSVSFSGVATGGATTTKRHLVATKVITSFNGDLSGYPFFFVPGGTINDNSTTVLNNVSFYDADLLDDATHLIDNYSEIPAGAVLTMYHDRLVLAATYTDISLALISAPGEPEAISQISGLITVPLDGNPITNAQELRDVLYFMKRSRTCAYEDNDDEPSTWEYSEIDSALGTSVHGIGTVLDSGGKNVDYLLISTYQGLCIFNGKYQIPELTFKVEDLWRGQFQNNFRFIQIINSVISKEIYIILPDRTLLVGNYANGFDEVGIRWTRYTFNQGVNTIAIYNINELILGSDIGPSD